jgi:hypothetical protein
MSQDEERPPTVGDREAAVRHREHAADDRETALTAREYLADAVLAADDERGTTARRILDDAERRDEVSDARDVDADGREGAASRAAFLDAQPGHSHDKPATRRAAALDRRHSKSDRTSAATDRAELAGDDHAPVAGEAD